MRARLCIAVVALMASSIGCAKWVSAQQLGSLDQLIGRDIEPSYPLVRCAAFYLANIEWAGQALDEDVFEESKTLMGDLLLASVLVRSKRAGAESEGLEHLAQTANADTRQIADLYLENYRRNYAATGTAWQGNTVWESDAVTCRELAENVLFSNAEIGE